jgi:hypothetical protein
VPSEDGAPANVRRKDPRVLAYVESALQLGTPPAKIARMAADQFEMSERNVKRYIREVMARMEDDERPAAQVEAMMIGAAQRAIAAGNHGVAVSALDKLARRKRATARSRRMQKEYEKLGPPPLADPLAGVEWLSKAQLVSAHDVITDPDISAEQRRHELRQIANVAARLVPDERLYDAERTIRRNHAMIDDVEPDREIEDAPERDQGSLRIDQD